jgi:putative ABC transport system permease protein
MIDSLLQDLRYSIRKLFKQPSLSIVALIALSLGIGANTAIFSVVNAVLLRPLFYRNSDRLVFVWGALRDKAEKSTTPSSIPNVRDWGEQNRVFDSLSSYTFDTLNLIGRDEPERVAVTLVSANLLDTLGVVPVVGRSFTPEEDDPSKSRVAMLSNGLWKRSFGGDVGVLGKTITLDGWNFTVVGVLPPEFKIPRQATPGTVIMDSIDLMIPVSFLGSVNPNIPTRRGRNFLTVIGQLKPGVSLEQAQADMAGVASGLESQYPDTNSKLTVDVVPLQEQLVGKIRSALLVLLGAVGFVLLIACANVANLLLALSAARQKEIAVRMALGAGRGRIIRQLLTESITLWLIGGALGLLLAIWGTNALLAIAPVDIPIRELAIDPRMFTFTLLITLVTGLVFGLIPAIQISKPDLDQSLKEGQKGSTRGVLSKGMRSMLVVSEVALALILLIGAGLMIRSFQRVLSADPGFEPKNLITMEMFLSPQRYSDDPQMVTFHRQLMDRIKNLPGVESVGAVNILPLKGDTFTPFEIAGQPTPPGQPFMVSHRIISTDYLQTMRIPLLKGRYFTDQDSEKAAQVTIISETLARRFWPDGDAIGKQVNIAFSPPGPHEVVGIVGDVKQGGFESESSPEVYVPYVQQPWPSLFLVVRTATQPASMGAFLRRAVLDIDKDQPVSQPTTVEEILNERVAQRRLNMLLLTVFAAVALLLAVAGIYGVMTYSVTQRTQEIGLRMALGAPPGHIFKLIVGQGMTLVIIGVAVGLVCGLALNQIMKSLLFGISATDMLTYFVLSVVLIAASLIACYIPARRATRVDPIEALRYE